jgi:hypothetical protein
LAGGGAVTRFRAIQVAIVVTIVLVALACLGVPLPLYGTFLLAFGWISFLGRVIPQINADASSAATGAIALLLLLVGLHLFLRWLSAAIAASRTADTAAITDESTPPAWLLRWTVSIIAIVLMMFVAGVSMVGVIHEVGWLATSPEPIISSSMRESSRKMQSSHHLRQIAMGMHNYEDVFAVLPGTIVTKDGQALRGWQATVLCMMDSELYSQIDESQPWNSPQNAAAFKRQISLFRIPHPKLPKKNAAGYALTHYAGNVHVMGGKERYGVKDITDGTANTLLIGEAAGNYRPWGYPYNYRDPMIGINTSADGFGSPWPSGAQFSMADGSVKFITNNIDPEVLRALATPAGGEKIGDW